jgi:hypothetical protein
MSIQQDLYLKRQKLQGIMLALKSFPQLNLLENGELVLEAIEHYIEDIDNQLKADAFNEEIKNEQNL